MIRLNSAGRWLFFMTVIATLALLLVGVLMWQQNGAELGDVIVLLGVLAFWAKALWSFAKAVQECGFRGWRGRASRIATWAIILAIVAAAVGAVIPFAQTHQIIWSRDEAMFGIPGFPWRALGMCWVVSVGVITFYVGKKFINRLIYAT
jgi:hypothetical protein